MTDGRGPLPQVLAPLAWCAARAYGLGVRLRNARFDRGAGVHRLEVSGARVPVISVGNLTAGGTGKSPFVAWICSELAGAGAQPVIAMRGYGAKAPEESDEAREYATTAPDARVVVDPDRVEALHEALSRVGPEELARCVVVLDDGFQHRRLARDLDIVLVDATRPGLDGDLLPAGWLREPAHGIVRAGLVVLTKAHDAVQRAHAAELVARIRGRLPDAACEHAWRAVTVLEGGAPRTAGVDALAGRKVLSACALGNPAHFHGMVERAGARIMQRFELRDHRAFSATELDAQASAVGAEAIVLSRKDLVKLHEMPKLPVFVPELGLRFLDVESEGRGGALALRTAINAAATRACASSRGSR